jgi:hypothetical protein
VLRDDLCDILAELSASIVSVECTDCKKVLCLELLWEGGSSELHRSLVLCGVGFLGSVLVTNWPAIIEKKSWWT